jgi:hypothetical protein
MPIRRWALPRLLSIAVIVYSLGLSAFAWLFASLQRCDEGCVPRAHPDASAPHWSQFADSWQWAAIVWLGVAAVALAGLMAMFAWRARHGPVAAAAIGWVTLVLAMWVLVDSASSNTGGDLVLWLILGVALVGGTTMAREPPERLIVGR